MQPFHNPRQAIAFIPLLSGLVGSEHYFLGPVDLNGTTGKTVGILKKHEPCLPLAGELKRVDSQNEL